MDCGTSVPGQSGWRLPPVASTFRSKWWISCAVQTGFGCWSLPPTWPSFSTCWPCNWRPPRNAERPSTPRERQATSLLLERATAIGGRHVGNQKICHPFVRVDLILDFGEPVAFVLVNFVFDHTSAFFYRLNHLLGLSLGAPRIIPAGEQIKWCLDPVYKINRRTILV